MSDQSQPPGQGFNPPQEPSGFEPPTPNHGTPPPGYSTPQPGYNNPATPPPAPAQQLPGLPYEPPPGYDAGGATPPPPQANPSTHNKAGFGSRFLAWFIDSLVVFVPFGILFTILATQLPTKGERLCIDSDDNIVLCDPLTDNSIIVVLVACAIWFLLALAYYAIGDGKRGATLGKKAANIRVVDDRTQQTIGIGRGVGRFFGRMVSAFPLYLGFLWMLWDKDKQTWHDKMTSSSVIKN